jgi:protein TonB
MHRWLLLAASTAFAVSCATSDPTPLSSRAASKMSPGAIVIGPSSQNETPARLISGSSPVYPLSILLKHKADGYALIQFTVGVDGRTHDVVALESSHKAFADHAIIAIRNWQFEPAKKDGVPVSVSAIQRMNFEKQ